jgi:hypothetical protein
MLAHGFQVINFLAAVILIAIGLALFVLFSRDKSKASLISFLVVCFGLSGLLLYLIFVPQ